MSSHPCATRADLVRACGNGRTDDAETLGRARSDEEQALSTSQEAAWPAWMQRALRPDTVAEWT